MEKTAAEATETPVMAAKTALAMTVAIPMPPLTRPRKNCAALNSSRVAPAMVEKSPIRTKSGTTAKT